MNCLFSDCHLLLYIPDISIWNNYNENNLNLKPDYQRIGKLLNFSTDIIILSPPPDIFNNYEFINEQAKDKIEKFFN